MYSISSIVKNPLYAGILCSKWTNYQAIPTQYEGLVSIEDWNSANTGKRTIIEEDGKYYIVEDTQKIATRHGRISDNVAYLFAPVLEFQGKPMRGYIHTKTGGIYYREAGTVGIHMNIAQRDLLEAIEQELHKYCLPDIFRDIFMDGILERFEQINTQYEKDRKKRKRELDKEIEKLEKENMKVARLLAHGEILPNIAKQIHQQNIRTIQHLSGQYIQKKELMLPSVAVELFEMFQNVCDIWKNGNAQQRRLLSMLFFHKLVIDWEGNTKKLTIENSELFDDIVAINASLTDEEWHPH